MGSGIDTRHGAQKLGLLFEILKISVKMKRPHTALNDCSVGGSCSDTKSRIFHGQTLVSQ